MVPFLFSLNGGIGTECSMFHKHVAEKIANKIDECYEKISFIQIIFFDNPHVYYVSEEVDIV